MHYAKEPISGGYLACFGPKDVQFGLGLQSVIPISDCSTSQFEMRITEGAGLGLFAKVKIKRGTKIIEEAPIASVYEGPDENGKLACYTEPTDSSLHSALHSLARVPHMVNELFERVRNEYQPANLTPQEEVVVYRRMVLLAVPFANTFSDGLFPTISRINHSCMPNCDKSDPKPGMPGVVTAARDIEIGEELTLTYVDPFFEHPDNKFKKLYNDYGFICTCICCTPSNRKSTNDRRLAIKRLANDIDFLHCQLIAKEYGTFQAVLGPIKGKMMNGPLAVSVSGEKNNDDKVWRTMFEMMVLITQDGIPMMSAAHLIAAAAYLSILLFRKRPSPKYKTLCTHFLKLAGRPVPVDVSEY